MKHMKTFVAALALTTALCLSANSSAATVNFNGTGSSAAFNTFALAAYQATSVSGACGTHIWTKKSGGSGIDSRSVSIPAQTGNLWVIWDAPTTPAVVCAYLSVDSVEGTRLFFAVPRATLSVLFASGTTGDNLVPSLTDEALDSGALAALQANSTFNSGVGDIRPEDALFATTRALATLTTNRSGLGYGPGPIGTSIKSPFSTKTSDVVNFALTGVDPISGQTVPSYAVTNVGAQVELVFVNTNDTTSTGLGNSAFNNVDRFVLARIFNGSSTRTRDLIPGGVSLGSAGIHVMQREPMSGTMNVMEFSMFRNTEIASSQEIGVNPTVDNPLNQTYTSGGTRQRVIGTGEMTSEVSATTNAIGYAFWSTGNFSKVLTNTKYLTVDGVDPLFANYTAGAIPSCTIPCPSVVSFTHVLDGSYPIWNILRVSTAKPAPASVTNLITAAQAFAVSHSPDFVPIASMNVFRSHYTQSSKSGVNGHKAGTTEAGGDEGGAVLTVEADNDNVTDTGKEITGLKQ